MKIGVDLSEFYLSVEWDILDVPASKNEEYYPCCTEPFSGMIIISIFVSNLTKKPLFIFMICRYYIQNDNET